MGNRASIEAYKRINKRSGHIDYVIEVFDDYGYASLILAEKSDIPDDNMELLKRVIELQHEHDEHGTSCDSVTAILDHIFEHSRGMYIGGIKYDWNDIKDTICYDIREVFFCPDCGWESFSDVDYEADCGQSNCDGNITEVKKEWYEK